MRTQTNIIGMLVAFSIFMLIVVGVVIQYLYFDISTAIIESVRSSIVLGSTAPIIATEPSLTTLRAQNLFAIALLTAAATIAFGYLLTRVALGPTRSALASQKQFIGNVAHELRTPLAIIKTNTEVALLSQTIPPETRAIMNSTIEELDRSSQIIDNLLSLSASVRPERMHFSVIDVGTVISRVVEKLQNLAKARNLEMTLRKGSQVHVWGNETALEQIAMNLVKNSINHTPRGGHIVVTTEEVHSSQSSQQAHVEIIVQDSGVGIARQDLFRIFEPFYRSEQSRNRAYGGAGLGLTIVSELVKLHHGKITVRSAVGRGTTVIVSLPSASVAGSDRTIRGSKTLDEVAVDFSHRAA